MQSYIVIELNVFTNEWFYLIFVSFQERLNEYKDLVKNLYNRLWIVEFENKRFLNIFPSLNGPEIKIDSPSAGKYNDYCLNLFKINYLLI